MRELEQRGVVANGPLMEAPGFLPFITVHDPDGNSVAISQYPRDPLIAV